MTHPDPTLVLDQIDAFRRSKVMFTAVRLGVFDHLHEAPAGVGNLAPSLGVDAGALERLLDACVSLGFLTKQVGLYANTPISDSYLCRSSAHSMTGYILYSDQVLFSLWGDLEGAIREGTHRWKRTFGVDGPIFNHFFRTPEAMRTFILGMHGFGMLSSPKVAGAFDLSGFARAADLGGASGHLMLAVCERYPNTRGVVFDLPQVLDVTREMLAGSPVGNRITLVAGDFFRDALPPADLYLLGRILHDWSEDKIEFLLGRIFEELPDGGGLLVAEKIVNADRSAPATALLQSLNMLVCTEGRERTLEEYRELLIRAGFRKVEGRVTGAPLDAILAIK